MVSQLKELIKKILGYVINYRDYQNSIVHAINELYEAKNFTILEKTRERFKFCVNRKN